MNIENILRIGDVSDNGQVTIVDEDRLCYLVKSESRGAVGLRTISKALLGEFVHYFTENPESNANTARDVLCGKTPIDKYEYGYTSTLTVMAKMVIENSARRVDYDTDQDKTEKKIQQIFYGAPGTGKSHKIKDDADVKAADEKNLIFRTTFHPDSDYSTFVGAYKPTTTKRAVRNVAGDIVTDTEKKEVYEDCITYSFIPQAFLQAYVAAWNNPDDKVFLVIEEINRGNCAQIFGDLFQLLDREDEGASEYPIMADKDIAKYLNGNDEEGRPVLTNKDGIKDGKLRLPRNLYIWATMNTSDQSLFPIDSAFKRRWEWKYIKIKEGKDENGNQLDWKVDVKMDEEGTLLPWWDFLKKINEIIASMTSSADKQLGYFFCCAKDGVIDEETFVSKVIFYLWNDVFKDYGFEDASLFRYTAKDEEGKDMEKDLTFPDFYDEEGEKVNTERLTDFVKKVMSWKVDDKKDEN